MNTAELLSKTVDLHFGKFTFSPSYLVAGAIVALLFLLVLTLAQFRRHLLSWSVKGALFGIFFGFLLALIFEGFLVISGRTAVTEILGWKSAPKPLLTILDLGRAKLSSVLGTQVEIPGLYATDGSTNEIIRSIQKLNPQEVSRLKSIICKP
jgi:hypothetical protein